MGLNESFNQVCGQIMMMDLIPSINVMLSMVTQDEKKKEVTSTLNPTETPMACVVQANNMNNFNKDRPTCAHFGVTDHIKENCFKLHGYPRIQETSKRQEWESKVTSFQVYTCLKLMLFNNSKSYLILILFLL
ncbi:unnamed protein product [Vicia faba]|uniref:Uncharacterized protein n=1 Tax=Vicia faba TaxID=3906 RepID=A0AAV0ZPX0_VICFA|nr:unnamed protein product [Vicia faba]